MSSTYVEGIKDKKIHTIRKGVKVTNKNKYILYVLEDENSGADFMLNIIKLLNPKTESLYYIGGGCEVTTNKILSFLNGETIQCNNISISYKNVNKIVFIHDLCTDAITMFDIVRRAKYHKIDVLSTRYYSFESVLYTYHKITNCFNVGKYRDIYLAISDFCCYYLARNYVNNEVLINAIMGKYKYYFDANFSQSFEQLQNTIFYESHLKLPCVRVNKHSYTPLNKVSGNSLRFYRDACDKKVVQYSYCYNQHNNGNCKHNDIKVCILLDMVTNTCLNQGLLLLNDGKTIFSLRGVALQC